ncbi:hypothetical protein AD947_07025 [Acetobacter tropicalis]|uniref:DUF4159 domain-containing protein n=1 Tax=Acetobacter tropicalis TaxID=104102 RepID=A0A149TYI0_9PROT|nr:DUF4159 domain-containing protein [Acetobacter tropicalis]KXV58157.1 hypothetical protein AD947_07025 [Acetobacter tropicalis]
MIFLTPFALLGLLILPLVWWLLKATPPTPRRQSFPPIQILRRLRPREADVARSPLWLLLVRLAAVTLLVLGLAHPVLPGEHVPTSGHGPLLLVLDDDMLSASGWSQRIATAQGFVDDAAHANRPVLLLRTAATSDSLGAQDTPHARPATIVQQELNSLRPAPWGTDRAALAHMLETHPPGDVGNVVYLANGVASTGDAAFSKALKALGPVQEVRFPDAPPLALAPASARNGPVIARILALPDASAPRSFTVRVHTQDGGTLAVVPVTLPAGASSADVPVELPNTVRNRIDQIALAGQASAAATVLFDEGDRLRPVGLMTSGAADTPLIGPLFYLRRALAPTADLHEGNGAALLTQPLSVIIAPDGTLADPATRQKVTDWVKNGGTLVRFAGPALAGEHHEAGQPAPAGEGEDDTAPQQPSAQTSTDPTTDLLPVALLDGSRQLGGTMTWGAPQKLAPFDAASPFHGLDIPADVTISQQVLASPVADLAAHSWARLTDGTPLVTHAALGKGEIVLFHISSTADWSNLPLSGLFVAMLQRLTDHANGVSIPADDSLLAPVMTLDGEGVLAPPPPSARGLKANAFADTAVSQAHPPGLYGPRAARRALNAGTHLVNLVPAQPVGTVTTPAGRRPDTPLGRYCLLAAALLLLLDAVMVLLMRAGVSFGKKNPTRSSTLSLTLLLAIGVPINARAAEAPAASATPAQSVQSPTLAGNQNADHTATPPPAEADSPTLPAPQPATASLASPQQGTPSVPGAALETRLAYVLTGHEDVDTVSRQGLQGLSDYTNARTSAKLGHPDGVRPGQDDLSYYPLLYWPITPDARTTPAQTAALTTFMAHGGILLIDTQGQDVSSQNEGDTSGSFAGDAPGTRSALRRVTSGLPIPPLATITDHHLLAHTFYMLHDFPGRYAGQPIWVAREGQAENDDVSPVIIGSADWAHAWAVDENGNTPYAVIPDGADQRQLAYRFGVNAVIYALTGNYKADQVHVPMLLQRLGE